MHLNQNLTMEEIKDLKNSNNNKKIKLTNTTIREITEILIKITSMRESLTIKIGEIANSHLMEEIAKEVVMESIEEEEIIEMENIEAEVEMDIEEEIFKIEIIMEVIEWKVEEEEVVEEEDLIIMIEITITILIKTNKKNNKLRKIQL